MYKSQISSKNQVLDLGSYPGGFSKAAAILSKHKKIPNIFSVDIRKQDKIKGVTFIHGDVTE